MITASRILSHLPSLQYLGMTVQASSPSPLPIPQDGGLIKGFAGLSLEQGREGLRLPDRLKKSTKLLIVDAHAGGEPAKVVIDGIGKVPGMDAFERMKYVESHLDQWRKLLLFEPRGSPPMNADIILPSSHPDALFSYIILEQTELVPMSGHNTICVATVLLEMGLISMKEPITEFNLEAPAGLVHITAECREGKAVSIRFKNVPSFVAHLDATINVQAMGRVKVDVAYGGMWYAIGNAEDLGIRLEIDKGRDLVKVGELIKRAAAEQLPVVHPENPSIAGISIIVLRGPAKHPETHAKAGADLSSRNAVVVSTGPFSWSDPSTWRGVIDRSPCGTGTCAVMAVEHARGRLKLGQTFAHESVCKTVFFGKIVEEVELPPLPRPVSSSSSRRQENDEAGAPAAEDEEGEKQGEGEAQGEKEPEQQQPTSTKAVVCEIQGSAYITGISFLSLDPLDPFPEGFKVGDIW